MRHRLMLCTCSVLHETHKPHWQRCYLVWLARSVQYRTETRKQSRRIIVITRQMSHNRMPFVLVIKGEEERAEENCRQAASDNCKKIFHTSLTEDRHERINDIGATLASSHGARIQSLKR